MRAFLRLVEAFITSPRTEMAIIALIVVNAITLGLETSDRAMAALGPALIALDRFVLAVFVVEILAKLAVTRMNFWRNPWNLFDALVVGVALVPTYGPFSVLRSLRILRVMRLISLVPSLRRVVGGLVAALPGMASIGLLMALIFYVFSVMATKLYGDAFPDWFGTIGASAYTLFQIMTLESWSMGIVRPLMETYPYAWLFFVPFILSTAFTVLNLFIGIIVSAMQSEYEEEADADRQAIHAETGTVLREVQALREDLHRLRADLEERVTPR